MQVNEKILKLQGKISVPQEYILGEDYTIEITGQIVKIEDLDNQDGTVNKVFVFKPLYVIGEDDALDNMMKDY